MAFNSNISNTSMTCLSLRSVLEKDKINGNDFLDWHAKGSGEVGSSNVNPNPKVAQRG